MQQRWPLQHVHDLLHAILSSFLNLVGCRQSCCLSSCLSLSRSCFFPPSLTPLSLPCYCCLGMAKSHAVSCAHFHIARTRRVKPMSLGFSSPRISLCFMMDMNSLLLSSPLPETEMLSISALRFHSIFHFWREANTHLPSQSNKANTTSHTWSDSSTLATVRATCFIVARQRAGGDNNLSARQSPMNYRFIYRKAKI